MVKSRSGGQGVIPASCRFNHPDGSFAGVVLTSVDVAYFIRGPRARCCSMCPRSPQYITHSRTVNIWLSGC